MRFLGRWQECHPETSLFSPFSPVSPTTGPGRQEGHCRANVGRYRLFRGEGGLGPLGSLCRPPGGGRRGNGFGQLCLDLFLHVDNEFVPQFCGYRRLRR